MMKNRVREHFPKDFIYVDLDDDGKGSGKLYKKKTATTGISG